MPYSSMYQPIPFKFLNNPGSRIGLLLSSVNTLPEIFPPWRLILPASLKSNAIALALLDEVEFKLIL